MSRLSHDRATDAQQASRGHDRAPGPAVQGAQDAHHELRHADAGFHHHHSHGGHGHHEHGHHLLQVEGLSVSFEMYAASGLAHACRTRSCVLDGLNISVHAGELLALVGASGSGKTMLADAVLGVYEPNVEVTGTIYFDGELQTPESLARLRGGRIAFVPQSVAALDPLMRVGAQIGGEPGRRVKLLERYRLGKDVERLYPHQLSGGMARRVLLACALVNDPQLIVADEPTPGLDLELAVRALDDLRTFADGGGGVLLITHDIELALRVADRIAVFKDGRVVEETSVQSFDDPSLLATPYARELCRALPSNAFASGEVGR